MKLSPSTARTYTDRSRRGSRTHRWVILCALLILLPLGCGRPIDPNVPTEQDFMRLHEANLERALNLPQYIPDTLSAEELEQNLGIVLADFKIRQQILKARRLRQAQWNRIKQRQEQLESFTAAGRERQRQRFTADYDRIRDLQSQPQPGLDEVEIQSQFDEIEQRKQEGIRRIEAEREEDRQDAIDLLDNLDVLLEQ